MKLRASSRTDEYRIDLLNSKNFLLESPRGQLIMKIINSSCGQTRSAYVLSHTPEQGEDFFRILVNGHSVVGFELPHDSPVPIDITITPVESYERMLRGSKEGRQRLSVALLLSQTDMR